MTLEKLDKEWTDINQNKDYKFLKNLLDALRQKDKDGDLPAGVLEDAEKRIGETVENDIWNEAIPEDLVKLADALEKNCLGVDFYLDKIFQENKLNVHALKLFFRFFPESLSTFYERLRTRHADLDFLSQVIQILTEIDLPVSLVVLKEIFFSENELIKLEVLKAMQSSKTLDKKFIFSLLGDNSIALKKEALKVLLRDVLNKRRALNLLLGMPSPWGTKNTLILENIMIIEILGLREANEYLLALSKRKFFWNKKLRVRALEVLNKWK